ncbi:MAG TPA: glycosyl transferase, partial [Spirochaetia bacterium]|nr:glycosyl transferase [Spirochaetia bacterium]
MGEKEIRGRTISPFFSVIIPVFNREKIVLRAVQSVLNQTFQDFELIVIDDGSADQT